MTFESHSGIRLRHSLAVVDDLYGGATGILHQDINSGGTCIDSILHQFLDDGCRTLHDLACGYLVGYGIGK